MVGAGLLLLAAAYVLVLGPSRVDEVVEDVIDVDVDDAMEAVGAR